MNAKQKITNGNICIMRILLIFLVISIVLDGHIFACGPEYCGSYCVTPNVILPGCNNDPYPECACYGQRLTYYYYSCCGKCSYWWMGYFCEPDESSSWIEVPDYTIEECYGNCHSGVGCSPGGCPGKVIYTEPTMVRGRCICLWWF